MIVRAVGDPPRSGLDGLRRIGVDEISSERGHRYLTIVCDHDTGTVVWAGEGKDAAALNEFYRALGPLNDVRHWRRFRWTWGPRTGGPRMTPRRKRRCRPFHLLKLASETVDVVRSRTLRASRDPQLRWALLKRPDHLTTAQQQLLDQLAADETDAWRAWSHREHFRAALQAHPGRRPRQ